MILWFGIRYDNFLTVDNLLTIMLNITAVGIAGFGTMLLLICGNVDLSIGGQFALVAVITGKVASETQNTGLAIAVALVCGTALGLLNGQLVRILRINPLIVTLGMAAILHGLAYVVTNAKSQFGFPESFGWLGRTKIGPVPLPVLIFLGVLLIGGFILLRTVIGLRIYAVGGNPTAADLAGVSANRVIGTMYAVNGFLIGLVALLTTSRLGSASPALGGSFELDVLTAVILGGISFVGGNGHPFGMFVGVMTIGVLNAGIIFAGVPDFWQQIVRGGVLLLALAGDQITARRRARRRTPEPRSVARTPADAQLAESPSGDRRPYVLEQGAVPEIEAADLSKSYGTVLAVDDVSFRVFAGEVVCLVGDNGAGKSSVIKMLSGAIEPDEGVIRIGGDEVSLSSPHMARAAGVQTAYQDLALCPNLGAKFNLVLGAEPRRANWGWLSVRDDRAAQRVAESRLGELGIVLDDYDRPVHLLSGGQRQSVAIARVASDDVKIVILDEPTAALGVKQTRNVLALIRTLAARGAAVILISHDIETVLEMSDRVVVLRLGRVIHEGPTSDLTHVRLVHLMAGLAPDADVAAPAMTAASSVG